MSTPSEDGSYLFDETDLEESVESLPRDCSIDAHVRERQQTFEDAMDHILMRGGWGEYLAANTIRLRVPVPRHLSAVFGLPDTDSDPPCLHLLLRIEENGAERLILDPVWRRDMTEAERLTMASHRDHRVMGSSPYTYMKPLLMSIQNDLELAAILGEDKGMMTCRVLDNARSSALRRLSLHSELHEGVFSLKEDRDKGLLADQIVEAGCQLHEYCKGRNLVKRAFDVVMFNFAHFGERCYVCGVGHQPPNENFIPAPCCNDLCRFKACERIRAQLYSIVKNQPGVFELVLMLATAAASSPRASLIFQPLPPEIDTGSLEGMLKHVVKIDGCQSENELEETLNKKDDRFYELMWWLIASLPIHITATSQAEIQPIIDALGDTTVVKDCSVFRVSCQSTSLNRDFLREKKRRNMDRYAYHGSPKENWYSILKHGPRVMSKEPKYKLHGSARGSGIYLGLQFTTSQGYAKRGGMVAICEVLNADSSEISKDSWCWVVKKPELVRIKYLLVPKVLLK
ncbi:hypothetical protein BSKO_08622 [Bryopsis sp. KO-2023]|nr:hypothetical protein BSKO_08622 [Bryopsis sp. KO-2023]